MGLKPEDNTIIVIDDDPTLNRLLCGQLRASGYRTQSARFWGEAETLLAQVEPALILLDMKLPDADGLDRVAMLSEICPTLVLTAYGSIDQAVKAIKLGAADYLTKPINPDALDLAVKRTLAVNSMRRNYEYFKRQATTSASQALVGASNAMGQLRQWVDIVGPSGATVLIQGESGVGKELVAAAVHKASARANSNFVAIDCSTLQASLFESELFGHERGAFTGADRRKEGLVEVGAGGTVFLDEIGEMSLGLQAKLLRVIETGHFRRVGGTRDLTADVRFVAATNRNLEELARNGGFREDLYYRLSAFVLQVPPLRDRVDDIPMLAEHFLKTRDFARHAHKKMAPGALDILMNYNWPGNVRELRNVVERAALVSGPEPEIRAVHVGPLRRPMRVQGVYQFSFDKPPTLDEIARVYLDRLLAEKDRSRAEIAGTLGISERNLYRMLRGRQGD